MSYYTDRDFIWLIELEGTYPMSNGWQVVVRAEWADETPQQPWGVEYAFILQDGNGERLLGFDNTHGYDGAVPAAPYDHEHRPGQLARRFPYTAKGPWDLFNSFLDRCEAYCQARSVVFDPAFAELKPC
jgi:hypothetical protein